MLLTFAGSTVIVHGDFTRSFKCRHKSCFGGIFFVDFLVRSGMVDVERTNLHWPLTSEPAANRYCIFELIRHVPIAATNMGLSEVVGKCHYAE